MLHKIFASLSEGYPGISINQNLLTRNFYQQSFSSQKKPISRSTNNTFCALALFPSLPRLPDLFFSPMTTASVAQIFMHLYQNLRLNKSLHLSFRSEKIYSNAQLELTLTCVIPIAKVPHNGPKVYKMKLAKNFQRWSHIQLTLTNSGLKYTS